MYQINIIDNYNSFISARYGPFSITKDNVVKDKGQPSKNEISDVIDDLKQVADKSLSQLKDENPNLLIFPENLSYYQDGFDNKEKRICTLYPEFGENKYIETGNVMGWIGFGQTQLKIYSRFDSNGASSKKYKIIPKKDFFMLHLLSRVGAFHVTALDYTEGKDSPIDSLVMLMMPECLKNAISQGLYKEYRTFDRNDFRVRGTINVSKHIRHNLPFAGDVAYRSREYSFDNDMTQLIRHTLEYMKDTPMGQSILNGDSELKQCVEMIYQATPTYETRNRGQIIKNNLRPKVHPYYTGYVTLQKLCLQILHEEGICYGVESDEKVHGILFDGAWLWEAYINRLLVKANLGFVHPNNIAKENAYKMFKASEDSTNAIGIDNRDAYPDFYNDHCVLDAKYKHLENRVQREDLFQVISYMHTMPRDVGGYIYPFQIQKKEDCPSVKPFLLNGRNGDGGRIFTIPFLIPSYKADTTWEKYEKEITSAEEEFINNLSLLRL